MTPKMLKGELIEALKDISGYVSWACKEDYKDELTPDADAVYRKALRAIALAEGAVERKALVFDGNTRQRRTVFGISKWPGMVRGFVRYGGRIEMVKRDIYDCWHISSDASFPARPPHGNPKSGTLTGCQTSSDSRTGK